MSPLFRVVLLLVVTLPRGLLAEDAAVAAPHADHSDAFPPGYRVREQDISADKRFAVLHADSNVIDTGKARNFLVAMEPFRTLGVTEGPAFYEPGNHRNMAVQWAKDHSAILVMIGDKWGTVGATLFELQKGKVSRRTDVMARINMLLGTKFPKGKVKPYNQTFQFILDGEDKFDLSEDGSAIRIDVVATNNPNLAPVKSWEGRLKAVWSVPKAGWVEQEVSGKVLPKPEE